MRNVNHVHGLAHSPGAPALIKAAALIIVVNLATAGCSSIGDRGSSSGSTMASTGEDQRRLAAAGRSQFLHCNSCHVVDASVPPPFGDSLGPHLEGIVGRPAASVEGFAYSDELQAVDLVWDEDTLDNWLRQPQSLLPSMCEPFTGITNPESRKALIVYLKDPAASMTLN